MARKQSGRVSFRINNEIQSTDGEFSIDMTSEKKEVFKDSNGEVLYSTEAVAGKISGSIYLTPTLSIENLLANDTVDISVQLGDESNRVFVMKSAIFTGDATVSAKDGKVDVEWMGDVTESV